MAFQRRHRRYLNAFKSPAHYSSQNPVHNADKKNNLVLRASELSKENVHQRDGSEHNSQTKPPDNPAVNANMDVVHKSLC